jgi:hypothetical protein
MPLSVPAGFVLLLAFVELGYRLNRLRFHHILSDKLVVKYYLFIEISSKAESSKFVGVCLFLLQEIPVISSTIRHDSYFMCSGILS